MSKLLIQYPTFSLYKTSQDLYSEHQKLVERLNKALKDDLPFSLKEWGFIADGYHPPLDHLRELRNNSRQVTTQLQTQYIERTGIPHLKIRYNNIIDYHIKIPPSRSTKSLLISFINKLLLLRFAIQRLNY